MRKSQKLCRWAQFVGLSMLLLSLSLPSGAQGVTLNLKKVTVQKAIEYLQREYGYSFSLKTKDVDVTRTVSLSAENASIQSVLTDLFAGQDVEFNVANSIVTVSSAAKDEKRASAQVQKGWTVSGKVYDENDDPMIGVVIMQSGVPGQGTTTDNNGSFSFKVSGNGPVTLVASFIGYEDGEMPLLAGQSTTRVKMRPLTHYLEEAVVVGYGTLTQKTVTSAVGKYKPDELDRRPVLSPDQALQGHLAGVQITSTSGTPDAATRVSIRGIGSIQAGNEPLWVVDGIPITGTSGDSGGSLGSTTTSNGLININPNDIESIEVLKDAASAAIYGSRATNGVIIVTTKKGKRGDARVDVHSSVSLGQAMRLDRLELADADSFIEMLNEGVDNYNMQNGTTVPRYANPAPGAASHNWEKDLVRTAVSHQTSVSVSGGSDKMLYYVSGGYKHSEGVIKTNQVNQYFMKVNLSGDIKKWLSFGINSQLSYTRNNRVVSGYSGYNVIKMAMEEYPWQEPRLPNGEWASPLNILIQNNPVMSLEETKSWVDTYRTISNAYIDIKPLQGLDFKTSLGVDYKFFLEHNYFTNKNYRARQSDENPMGGSLEDLRKSRPTVLWENTLTYKNQWQNGLELNAVLGHAYQYDVTDIATQLGYSFPSSQLDVNDVATNFPKVKTTKTEFAMQSFFARAMLNYKDRYIFTGTVRTDGTSKFYPSFKTRYGWFPSVSAGWNMNEEPWWHADGITAKLRASWGMTGNQGDINAYAYQALATSGYNYNGKNGFMLTSLGNEDLKWETAAQTNLGFDLSFFKGALGITADVFNKDTYNLLYAMPTMATTGFTTYTNNIGAMNNKGLELTLTGAAGKGDFRWRGNFNISFVKNQLTKLLDDRKEPIAIGQVNGLQVGQEVGSFYVVKFLGIYQSDDEVPESLYAKGVRAGDCIYEDIAGAFDENGNPIPDGDITTADDRQFVGSPNPKFTGGFGSIFSWKGFDLNAQFTFSYGNQLYEYLTGGLRLGNGIWPALRSAVESRWTGPGTTNENPRPLYNGQWNNTQFVNSRFIHDASYLRCRNLSLGYTFPYKVTDKLRIQALKLYVQVDNLFLLSPWPYLDPEVSSYSSAPQFGSDWMSIGQPRTFTFGVNIKF